MQIRPVRQEENEKTPASVGIWYLIDASFQSEEISGPH